MEYLYSSRSQDLSSSSDRWISRATACNSQVVSISTTRRTWDVSRTFVMHLGHIVVADEFPAILFDVVEITRVSRESITMTGSVDTPAAKFLCLFVGQVPVVSLIQHTIGESASRANRKQIAFEACSV